MTADLPDLLERARRGDASAFDRLFEQEAEFLQAQVNRHLDSGLRSLLEAEDIVQETRLRVVRHFEQARFDSAVAFRAWIARIVRNVVVDLRRRHFLTRKRTTPRSIDEALGASTSGTTLRDRLHAEGPGPSSIVRRREDVSQLAKAMQQLKPHHHEILRLVYFDRVRMSDIAVRTGRKPATVRKELERAVLACRKILDGMQGDGTQA